MAGPDPRTSIRSAPQVFVGALTIAGGAAIASAQPASFNGLGPLSSASALSADGSTVIGHAAGLGSRWTAVSGWMGLPAPPGHPGASWNPAAVSADGTVVVGHLYSGESLALRWTETSGTVNLGAPNGYALLAEATAVSSDGAVVVGRASKQTGMCTGPSGFGYLLETTAWRWTADTASFHKLNPLSGDSNSEATAVSGDGTAVFGVSYDDATCTSSPPRLAGLWEGNGPAAPLLGPGGSPSGGVPQAASVDGTVAIVGASRWTASGGVVSIPGIWAEALSADGATLVGHGGGSPPAVATMWDPSHGVRNLRGVLTDLGLNLSGWTLANAVGLSADGRTIVGNGTNPAGQPEAWLAFLGDVVCYGDCTADGALTVADFGCFQTKFVAGDPYGDCNGDGQFTVSDFGCFQTAFVTGCP